MIPFTLWFLLFMDNKMEIYKYPETIENEATCEVIAAHMFEAYSKQNIPVMAIECQSEIDV